MSAWHRSMKCCVARMQGSLADTADLNATKQIGEMAKKAHELMQHQEEIERRVSQRWGDVSTAGDSWAGHYLPAVQVTATVGFALCFGGRGLT